MRTSIATDTHEILEECTGLAAQAFPETGGACTAREAGLYLAHTEKGASIRALAAAAGTHPSTVLRTVRRVEARRDDPLIDASLASLGEDAPEAEAATGHDEEEIRRAALRYLRRLNEPGSILVVANEASQAGIFCRANELRKPIAMMPTEIAAEFVKRDWIRLIKQASRTARYEISDVGRGFLRRLLAEQAEKRREQHGSVQALAGFAEAPTPFLAQHRVEGERSFTEADGSVSTRKVNLGETPLGWLSRRKGPDGKVFLTAQEYEAGERLRSDFEAAQIQPSVAQDWRRFLTPQDKYSGSPTGRGPCEGPMAARQRLSDALESLGSGLSDAALRVCCFLEGIEATERRMGWNARSGKVVLKIALQRLADFYGIASGR